LSGFLLHVQYLRKSQSILGKHYTLEQFEFLWFINIDVLPSPSTKTTVTKPVFSYCKVRKISSQQLITGKVLYNFVLVCRWCVALTSTSYNLFRKRRYLRRMINQHHFGRKPVVSSIYFFEQIRGLIKRPAGHQEDLQD